MDHKQGVNDEESMGDVISGLERHLAAKMGKYRSSDNFNADFIENGAFYDKDYFGRPVGSATWPV
jgi:hypothetical protein